MTVCIKWAWLILFMQNTIATIHKLFPKQFDSNSKQLQSKDHLKVTDIILLSIIMYYSFVEE